MVYYIEKFFAAVLGTAGLLFSTEQVIFEVNYGFLIVALISSILSAYGLYHLVKDLRKYVRNR